MKSSGTDDPETDGTRIAIEETTTEAKIGNRVNDKTIIEGITITTFIGETSEARIDNMVNDKTIIEGTTRTTTIGETTVGETTEEHRTEAYGTQLIRTITYVTNLL